MIAPERLQHDRITRDTERLAHDGINRDRTTMRDSLGGIGLPWRVESLLARLERHGDIGYRERLAGEEFARWFQTAHLDPLRAASLLRGDAGGAALGHGSERARRRIIGALDALGGHGSPCGSCAWHVLGTELSLRAWATREGWGGRPLRPEVAKGTLLGTLGVLVKHFGI